MILTLVVLVSSLRWHSSSGLHTCFAMHVAQLSLLHYPLPWLPCPDTPETSQFPGHPFAQYAWCGSWNKELLYDPSEAKTGIKVRISCEHTLQRSLCSSEFASAVSFGRCPLGTGREAWAAGWGPWRKLTPVHRRWCRAQAQATGEPATSAVYKKKSYSHEGQTQVGRRVGLRCFSWNSGTQRYTRNVSEVKWWTGKSNAMVILVPDLRQIFFRFSCFRWAFS